MAKVLQGINGALVTVDITTSAKPEDQVLTVVSGVPSGSTEVQGPISSGTPLTLPNGMTYEDSDLQVYFNGQSRDVVFDYAYEGAGPTRTQISMTFDLEVGDYLSFRVDK